MRHVRFSGRALAQLRAIARYLLRQTGDERAGERFVRDIESHVLKFADLPGTPGRPRPELGPGIRSFPHHAYVVIFRYTDASLDIVQIIHALRDIDAAR